MDRRFDTRRLGQAGEQRAARWYVSHGYRLVVQNWRCPEGEIDLVAAKGDLVVFAEVKTRTSDRYGSPFDAVDWRKQRRIRRLAAIWMAEHPTRVARSIRFDVVGVKGTTVEVREASF